jgi:uncharacterized membrane protein
MSAWTRGDKIAAWSLLIAVISCVAALYTIPPFQRFVQRLTDAPPQQGPAPAPLVSGMLPGGRSVTEPDTSEEQRRLEEERRKHLEEQRQALRQEALQVHDERVEIRKDRIAKLASSYTSSGKPLYDRVVFTNDCSKAVNVAVHYRDLDDVWVTRGWWTVDPGETTVTDVKTRNALVYFFARNRDEDLSWNGEGEEGAARKPVSPRKFYLIQGDDFEYPDQEEVTFFRRESPSGWGDHKRRFTCEGQ